MIVEPGVRPVTVAVATPDEFVAADGALAMPATLLENETSALTMGLPLVSFTVAVNVAVPSCTTLGAEISNDEFDPEVGGL